MKGMGTTLPAIGRSRPGFCCCHLAGSTEPDPSAVGTLGTHTAALVQNQTCGAEGGGRRGGGEEGEVEGRGGEGRGGEERGGEGGEGGEGREGRGGEERR